MIKTVIQSICVFSLLLFAAQYAENRSVAHYSDSFALAPFTSGLSTGGDVDVDISFQEALNDNSDARLGEHFIISYFPDGEFKLTLKDQRRVSGREVLLRSGLRTRADMLKVFLALGTLKDAGAKHVRLVLDIDGIEDAQVGAMLSSRVCRTAMVSLFGDAGADECFMRDGGGLVREDIIFLFNAGDMSMGDRSSVADVDAVVFFEKDRDFADGIKASLPEGVPCVGLASISDFFHTLVPLPVNVLIAARPQSPDDVIDLMLLSRTLARRGHMVDVYSGAIAMARQHKSWSPKFHTYIAPELELDSPEAALESASMRFVLENIGCRWFIGHNLHFVKAGMVEVYNVSSAAAIPGIIDVNAFPDLLASTVESVRERSPGRRIFVFGADKGVSADMADAAPALRDMGIAAVGYLNKHRISSTKVSYDGNIYGVDGRLIPPDELRDAVVIIADDEISSGGTISEAAALIGRLSGGRAEVYMSVVIGKFSGNCWERISSVGCVKGVFVSDLFATSHSAQPEAAAGLLRKVVFAGRFMDNMRLFAGINQRSFRWRYFEMDDGVEFAGKYPYILKAFVYSILNKRMLSLQDLSSLLGLINLLERLPVSADTMTMAALIELKIKLSLKAAGDRPAFVRMRDEYSRQGMKLRLITELCTTVYYLIDKLNPGTGVFNHDIVTVSETVVSCLKDKHISSYSEAKEKILGNGYSLHPRLAPEKAKLIASYVIEALFSDIRFKYLYEVHGDEAYSEDMSEIMKVDDNDEFARVLFVNIARMLHLRYSVVFSERLRFMLSETLKILNPDFRGLDYEDFGVGSDTTIRDILVSVFARSDDDEHFGGMRAAYAAERSA